MVVGAASREHARARAHALWAQLATYLIDGVLSGFNPRKPVRLKRWSKSSRVYRLLPGCRVQLRRPRGNAAEVERQAQMPSRKMASPGWVEVATVVGPS